MSTPTPKHDSDVTASPATPEDPARRDALEKLAALSTWLAPSALMLLRSQRASAASKENEEDPPPPPD